jgi:hypothetical protein
MIPQNKYRIDEYQISEFSDGRIWWTSHSGFAIQIGGPCYVLGNVLLIGDRRSEEKWVAHIPNTSEDECCCSST